MTKAVDGDSDPGAAKAVDPGHPENSEFWLALAAKTLGRTDTSLKPMPLDALPLTGDELEGVRLWILGGAPSMASSLGVADLIDACPQSSYDGAMRACRSARRETPCCSSPICALTPDDVQVVSRDGHRLEYTSSVANTGAGPLIVQAATPATHPGQMIDAQQIILRADGSKCVHPAGSSATRRRDRRGLTRISATYELRKDDPFTGDLVAQVSKTAYCLLDTDPIRAADNRPHPIRGALQGRHRAHGHLGGVQGRLPPLPPGQWIDLDADLETPVTRRSILSGEHCQSG